MRYAFKRALRNFVCMCARAFILYSVCVLELADVQLANASKILPLSHLFIVSTFPFLSNYVEFLLATILLYYIILYIYISPLKYIDLILRLQTMEFHRLRLEKSQLLFVSRFAWLV